MTVTVTKLPLDTCHGHFMNAVRHVDVSVSVCHVYLNVTGSVTGRQSVTTTYPQQGPMITETFE